MTAIPARAAEGSAAKILDIPLDADTQRAIYGICEQDDGLFCAVMAIAAHESGFRPDVVNPRSGCVGLMQIHPRHNAARIARLGVDNLFDPVQNARVAVDLLRELMCVMDAGLDDHRLYMAYAMGPDGARRALRQGMTGTAYSRAVMTGIRENKQWLNTVTYG